MKTKKDIDYSAEVKKIQANFWPQGPFQDIRVTLPLAKAYLLAGRFECIANANVILFEPVARNLGCGVYQLLAKRC